jgi:citrate synthase
MCVIFLVLQLDISDTSIINAQALKQIKAGGDGVGLRVYDPG